MQFAANVQRRPGGKAIAAWADLVIRQMGEELEQTEVCIRVVGENESRTLNAGFRNRDKPTNVLSFPADMTLPGSEVRILGDVVVCAPVVRREAVEQNKKMNDHFAHMVVHGMLHLYGYDHIDAGEADAMENLEKDILGVLGVADPYEPVRRGR